MSGLGNGGPDDNDAQAGRLVSARNTGKGWWTEGDPSLRAHPGGIPENLIAHAVKPNERNTSQGPGNYVTHALMAEGHDAGEDGTGRGTPIIAFHMLQDPISEEGGGLASDG